MPRVQQCTPASPCMQKAVRHPFLSHVEAASSCESLKLKVYQLSTASLCFTHIQPCNADRTPDISSTVLLFYVLHHCSAGLNIATLAFDAELAEHVIPAKQNPTSETLALPKPDILVKAPAGSTDVDSRRVTFQVHPLADLLAASALTCSLAAASFASLESRPRPGTDCLLCLHCASS